MTLQEHREEQKEDDRSDRYRSEFHYGSVLRRIRLPEGAIEVDVKPSSVDGILEGQRADADQRNRNRQTAVERS